MKKNQLLQIISMVGLFAIIASACILISESSGAEETSITDGDVTYSLNESGLGNYAIVSSVNDQSITITIKSTVDHSGKKYEVRSIEETVFKNNKNITNIIVHTNDNFVLKNEQFKGCTSLETIEFKDGLKEIADKSFAGCKALKTVILPSTVKSIGNNCFENCAALTAINTENIQTIGTGAFSGCIGLETIDLTNVTNVSENAFYGCTKLNSVNLNSIKNLGASAFHKCGSLESINIGNGLVEIGIYALSETGITDLSLPATVLKINMGTSNAHSCFPSGLLSLTIDENNPKYASDNNMLIDKETETILYGFNVSGEITVSKNVDDGAFSKNQKITKLRIDEGVSSIGSSAFSENSELTEVILPSTLSNIGSGAFYGCKKLTKIDATNGLEIIGGFSSCTGLTTVSLPDSVKHIDEIAFHSCSNLESINLPSGLKTVGVRAFDGCKKLSLSGLPDSLDEIGDEAFKSVDFGNTNFVFGKNKEIKIGAEALKTTGTVTLHNKVVFKDEYTAVRSVSASGTLLLGDDFDLFEYRDGWIISKDGKTLYGRDLNNVVTKLVIPSSVERIVGTGFQNRWEDTHTKFTITCEDPTKTLELYCGYGSWGVFAYLYDVTSIELPNIIVTEGSTFDYCRAETIKIESMNEVPTRTFTGNYVKEITVGGYTKITGPIVESLAKYVLIRWISFPDTLVEANLTTPYQAQLNLYDADGTKITFSDVNYKANAKLIAGKTFYREDTKKKNFYEVPENEIILVNELSSGNTYQKISKADKYVGITGSGQVYRIAEGKVLVTLYVGDEKHYVAADKDSTGGISAPDKVGYRFDGWFTDSEFTTPFDSSAAIAAGQELYAKFTINQYSITFDTAGGSEMGAITQDYDSAVTKPADPTRNGYKFLGWDKEIPEKMPVDGLTVKAVWAVDAVANDEGKSVVKLDAETDSFVPAKETKEITVELGENAVVKVENASELVGKTVVSKLEAVANTTDMEGVAYEFTITADGTQFNGKMQITLPYVKEDGKKPVVYYWNGSESVKMKVISSTDTSVTFETDHNSLYVVASETPSKDSSLMLIFGAILVAGIAVAMLLGLNFYRKKA